MIFAKFHPFFLIIFFEFLWKIEDFGEYGGWFRGSGVCKKWRKAVNQSMARRESLSFAGWKMDDDSTSRLVHLAYNLKELDM